MTTPPTPQEIANRLRLLSQQMQDLGAAMESGCPVRAGIGPMQIINVIQGSGLPRASGDRPFQRRNQAVDLAVAPCERG